MLKKMALLLSSVIVVAVAAEVGLIFAHINTLVGHAVCRRGKGYDPHPRTPTFAGPRKAGRKAISIRTAFATTSGPTKRRRGCSESWCSAIPMLRRSRSRLNSRFLHGWKNCSTRFDDRAESGSALAWAIGVRHGEGYLRYVNFGAKYSPDLVLLAFLTGRDFRKDNSSYLSGHSHEFWFDLGPDKQLIPDRLFLDRYEQSLTSVNGSFSGSSRSRISPV